MVDYVLVRGYVAILTGRSRSTADIDIIERHGDSPVFNAGRRSSPGPPREPRSTAVRDAGLPPGPESAAVE
ncbi:hypothetical protein ACFFOL_08385 [Halobaculum roseum]|uniref:Nucleotidyltransferase domain-containing protein n=1 Tax=Halobaculum roseum TaxID=2175149 RepID=A0ABD5MP73_9EURY